MEWRIFPLGNKKITFLKVCSLKLDTDFFPGSVVCTGKSWKYEHKENVVLTFNGRAYNSPICGDLRLNSQQHSIHGLITQGINTHLWRAMCQYRKRRQHGQSRESKI